MRKKRVILSVLICSFLFFISSLSFSQSKKFRLGFTGCYPNIYHYNETVAQDFSWYSELKMNMWQGWGMEYALVFGSLNTDMHTTLDNLNSHSMGGYFQPDTLNFLSAIGRVSIHEAEVNPTYSDNSANPYYYENHTTYFPSTDNGETFPSYVYGTDITDNWNSTTQKVRYYDKATWQSGSNHDPVTVLSHIEENYEQSFMSIPSQHPLKSDKWFLRPRMRIKSSAFSNPNDEVVKIIYRAYDGTIIKEQILNVSNFKNSQGSNETNYIERYFDGLDEINLSFLSGQSNPTNSINKGHPGLSDDGLFWDYYWHGPDCHVDYEIQWYGKVDVYIDYVKVMDQGAFDLFYNSNVRDAITTEASKLLNYTNGANFLQGFYTEEIQYCNLECLKELKSLLNGAFPSNTSNVKIVSLYNPISFDALLKSRSLDRYKRYLDYVQPSRVMFVDYCFRGADAWLGTRLPDNISLDFGTNQYPYGSVIQNRISGTYNAFKTTKAVYNAYLQDTIWRDNIKLLIDMHNLCSQRNIEMDYVPQIISWDGNTGPQYFREPMNSEITALFCISLCHGVKGILPYAYESFTEHYTSIQPSYLYYWHTGIMGGVQGTQAAGPSYFFTFGMTDVTYSSSVPSGYDFKWGEHKRTNNFYGENKWDTVKKLFSKLDKWGPVIANSSSTTGFTVSSEGATHNFIYDIQSIVPGVSGQNPCLNDYQTSTFPSGPFMDCPDERYWEMGFFTPDYVTDNSKYFMMVNKRCIPATGGYAGDKRQLKIRFNASYLPNFANWNVVDVNTNTLITTVNKNSSTYYNFGEFQPGEGRMYKLVPTLIIGGALETNENLSEVTFDCDSSVTATNKNITIGANVTINFKNNARIKMSGGNFICGTVSEALNAPKSVILNAQSGMKWGGIVLENMDTVHIQNTEIKDVDADADNHGYGISLINAKVINIDNCNVFNTSSTAAGIQINYVTNLYINPNINITGNIIKIETDTCDGIYIHPYSWLILTPYIYANKIINTSSGGEFGIFGFDLEGTAVKNNYIENFQNGILTWYSSLDLFENTITTSNITNGWDLYGIVSEYNLSNAYESRLGGSNVLTTKDGRNICLDALDINLTDGNNIFNVNDSSYGYHMAGYYPTSDLGKQNAYNNCFKIMGVPVGDENQIRKNVTESDGLTQVTFDFGTFSCPSSPNYCDFYIGGTPTDTVWIECGGGMGGGMKNSEFGMQNVELEETSAPQENVYKQIYDSLSINMRKKQYELASDKCITLLDNYPDSAKVINCVDKLYRTALVRNKVSEMKSYYESFIQNHPNNTQIINRMFYYIQKAKAKLGQYTSALQGFQTIINQFPTSYEGLAARWDYMATQLLDTSSGTGGGEQLAVSSEQLTAELEHEKLINLVEDPLDKYDKKKFSKEDRKVIVNNIVSAFETQKTKEVKKLKELEVKITKNEANETEKKEYKTKSKLKEVVRPQKVRNISEQIAVVQGDIKKVFPLSEKKGNIENKISVIPLEYELSQNYPNPFNPTTKINYEIPKGGFVSIKIYDLLGREIAELVNENKDPGRYTIDFNASKYLLASGIYFYRIKAGEFINTKRMVLVK